MLRDNTVTPAPMLENRAPLLLLLPVKTTHIKTVRDWTHLPWVLGTVRTQSCLSPTVHYFRDDNLALTREARLDDVEFLWVSFLMI